MLIARSIKNAEGVQVEKTQWIECALWDSEKVAQYLKKGTQVYVTGMPEVSAYANKQGEPVGSFRLRVQRLELLGGNKKEDIKPVTTAAEVNERAEALAAANVGTTDDLPF